MLESPHKQAPVRIKSQRLSALRWIEGNAVVRPHGGVFIDLVLQSAVGKCQLDIVRAGVELENGCAVGNRPTTADHIDAGDELRDECVVRARLLQVQSTLVDR